MLSSRTYPAWIKIGIALCMCGQCVSGQRTQTAAFPPEGNTYRTVYIIQTYYHTEITIELDAEARRCLEVARYFKRHRYVDIGWGDEVFYQDPTFTLSKAARAILVPTSSVVRVEGFNRNVRDVIAFSDRAVMILITEREFARLCEFINGSLEKGPDENLIVASVHGAGDIMFFKSPYSYDLSNTCNTWIASTFKYAGLDISPVCVVTAGTLFRKLSGIGEKQKKLP